MYLKALEIQGFKSFPDRTRLTFEKDITAIVGPNGSGKSNISDALLWVMGEQRSRALRGGKMEDVIFGGTEKRSPMGFAQVTLVLDNSGGLFELDTPEVSITRRYYRNGESEYYVNREAVRLRDITDLLTDTGLGRDGYSVIGQGRIAEIVSAKSTDRREVFEEAAGIARYRRRKEEAERKLAGTQDNLLRINDKIDELEMQVAPLEKQAQTAKRYLVLRDEQRETEVSVWMETLDRLRVQSEQAQRDCDGAKKSLESARTELDRLYAESESIASRMRDCDVLAETLRSKRSEEESAAAECESGAAVLKTSLQHSRELIERISGEMDEQTSRARSLSEQIESRRARLAEIECEKTAQERVISGIFSENEQNDEKNSALRNEMTRLTERESEEAEILTQSETMISMLSDRLAELRTRRESIDGDIAAGEKKYDDITSRFRAAREEQDAAQARIDEINNIINGHKMRMAAREGRAAELTEEYNRITVEKRSAQGRAHMLSEMEKEYEGLGKAVKTVMHAAERGTLHGVYGPVAGLITVDERCAVAIETALGGAMQNIVVDTQESGKAAIDMLKRCDGGRATFLPVSTIRPNVLRRVPTGEEGFIGVASDLVEFDRKYENVFLNLLGRTVVTQTLGDAVRISRKFDNQLRIVSLDGQLINAGGSMTGGSAARSVGILSRANELKQLRGRIAELEEKEKSCAAALGEAKRELEGAKYEMNAAQAEKSDRAEELHRAQSAVEQLKLLQSAADEALETLDAEKHSLSARIGECEERAAEAGNRAEKAQKELAEIRSAAQRLDDSCGELEAVRTTLRERAAASRECIASLESEKETIQGSVKSLEELLAAMSGDGEEQRRSIAELETKCTQSETELLSIQSELEKRRADIAQLSVQLDGILASRLELEGRRTVSDRASQDKNREMLDLQSVCARFEQKLAAAEMEENQIVEKLWESYELSRTAAQNLRKPVESMPQAQKRITELKREIGRLGSVNLGAIEEYARVKERYDFLAGQRDDVAKAKRELEKIISDLTGEMREIFTAKFAEINEKFREVFLELFGGGKASLQLEDEENVLECGIEIKVQPPGKAVTTISLLSGGEKSFVAIALYFAIMKVRPTPFCIMDEIDAALDEANVTRYAQYMRSMAGKTQFIAITHHRATMEEADVLYGVTMQEKGVTTVISVDLDEAERTIQ